MSLHYRHVVPYSRQKLSSWAVKAVAHAAAAAQVEGSHHTVPLLHILDLVAHILHDAHELRGHDMMDMRTRVRGRSCKQVCCCIAAAQLSECVATMNTTAVVTGSPKRNRAGNCRASSRCKRVVLHCCCCIDPGTT